MAAIIICALIVPTAAAHDSGFGLARYSADGSLDHSFGSGGIVVSRSAQSSFVANALTLQADGKIIVGGMNSNIASGSLELAVARYNTDGSPDAGFASGGIAATAVGEAGGEANAIAVQPDGALLVAGTAFSHGISNDEVLLARYTPTGSLDTNFGTAGVITTHLGAGPSAAAALVLQPDGRIVVVGTAYSNGATDDDFGAARYTSSGRLDQTFGNGGIVTTDFGSQTNAVRASLDRATAIALQPDGKVLVAGFTRGDHQAFAVARYNRDGKLDTSFGKDGKAQVDATEPQVFSMMLQSTGDIVLAGSTSGPNGTAPFALARLLGDGTPDELFGTGGIVSTAFEGSRSGARAVVAQADGKLITGGAKFGAPSAQGDAVPQSGFALARYRADGSIDAAFGDQGRALTDIGDAGATPLSLAVQPDGRILAAGLVFFQVPTPRAATNTGLPVIVMIVVLSAIVVPGIVILVVLTRRRAKRA